MNEKIINELVLLNEEQVKIQFEILSLLQILKENYTTEKHMEDWGNE